MNTLNISKIKCHCRRELQQPRIEIGCNNWPDEFPSDLSANFSIAHDSESLYIRFRVTETYIMAKVEADNGPVWTDSCCEFFVSFDDRGYYNFEFSCIGKALLAFRKNKPNPTPAPPSVLDLIERNSTLGDRCFDEFKAANMDQGNWELNIRIPRAAFFMHDFKTLDGLSARGNFYKCGDGLTVPHFLSWAPIKSDHPNFHLPAYFGNLLFLE